MENKILIEKAIYFIQKSPKENLSLQSIAENAGFSLTYFDAIFQKHTGYSPVEYSRIYKLTRSALELRRTKKTILDIALDFGYASPESFTRAFKSFYSMTPSEYRAKYAKKAVEWHDLSGKIAISHFKRNYPELKEVDMDTALDYCFTHHPLLYAEDIIGITVGDAEVFTLGDPENPQHFIYVSDYNQPEAAVNFVCGKEADAILYLQMLAKNENTQFTIHRAVDEEWETFDAEVAKHGLTCRFGYDMIYSGTEVIVPEGSNMTVRELTAEDLPFVWAFRRNGGCADCHVRGLQAAFDGKGNAGERGFGLFIGNEMVCLATPVLDKIRELKKYDIGAIFAIKQGNRPEALELMWKYIIDVCLKEGATIGNANAYEDDSPLGVAMSEKVGLVKIAKNCRYSK
ncbi:MAG: helix-turn-helix transcriptional regulator [Clostridia bacterium]|nr:helix-turn-helix transcriptional regulator [Clostridia bacterium]